MADKVIVEIIIDDKKAVKSVKQFGTTVKKSASKAGDQVGGAFSTGISNQLANLGPLLAGVFSIIAVKNAITGFAEFEQALVGVQKTTDLTDESTARFGKTLQALSERIPVSARELANLAETAGRFGVRGAKNLELFTETLAKLQVATDLVGDEGAQSLVRIIGVTGESIDTIATLGAVITDLGNNFRTSESQIVALGNELARATAQFSISAPQVIAISTALSDLGAKAEGSGTAVGKALRTIEKALLDGGDTLKRFTRLTGLTADELEKTFSEDAAKVFQLFIKGLNQVAKAGGSVTRELTNLGLSQDRTLKSLVPLATGYQRLELAVNRANDQVRDATALDIEAAKAFDTLQSEAQKTANAFTNFTTVLVSSVEPALRAATRIAGEFFKTLTDGLKVIGGDEIAKLDGQIKDLRKTIAEATISGTAVTGSGFLGFNVSTVTTDLRGLETQLATLLVARANLLRAQAEKGGADVAQSFSKGLDEGLSVAVNKTPIVFDTLANTIGGFTNLVSTSFSQLSSNISKTVKFTEKEVMALTRTFKTTLANGISQGIQRTIQSIAQGQNAFAALGKSILNLIGDLAISIGQFVIATGVAKIALELLPGGAAVAAGLGLVALGTVLKLLGGNSFVGGDAATGGGVVPTGGGAQIPEPAAEEDEIVEREPRVNVDIIVQGNILDRRETGLELADVIRETLQSNDINLGIA